MTEQLQTTGNGTWTPGYDARGSGCGQGAELSELDCMKLAMEARAKAEDAIRGDAYRRVLASAKTMTRSVLIQWLELECQQHD